MHSEANTSLSGFFFFFFDLVRLFVRKNRAASFPLGVMDQRPCRSPVPVFTCSLIMMQETYLNKLLFVIKVNYFSELPKCSLTTSLVKELSVVQLCAKEQQVPILGKFLLYCCCDAGPQVYLMPEKKKIPHQNSSELTKSNYLLGTSVTV